MILTHWRTFHLKIVTNIWKHTVKLKYKFYLIAYESYGMTYILIINIKAAENYKAITKERARLIELDVDGRSTLADSQKFTKIDENSQKFIRNKNPDLSTKKTYINIQGKTAGDIAGIQEPYYLF